MRWLIFIVLLLIFALVIYQNHQAPHISLNTLSDRVSRPLDFRLRYRIGDVDPRFGLSDQEVQDLSYAAEQIWERGLNTDLFVYDPTAKLSINLIYDHRQVDSTARKEAKDWIESSKQSQMEHKQQLRLLQDDLEQQKLKLDAFYRDVQQQHHLYQNNLNDWNQSARQDQFALSQLREQKNQLDQHNHQYEMMRQDYNQQLNHLNQQALTFNSQVSDLNQSVQQFNQTFVPYQFDKGQFDGKSVKIYEFQSANDLKITIAHELGHALGLKHHHDPKALMYPMMEKQNLQHFVLQPADIELYERR